MKIVMAPKISVCIPTYNYAHYISFAVESVLNQQFTDFELIIVDDCSKDNTEEVVSRFLYDKRVSFEKNERNLGLVGNWNKCLSKARGEYIKFVFADDMLASDEALGRMAEYFGLGPVGFAGGLGKTSYRFTIQNCRTCITFPSGFHRRWSGYHRPLPERG